jgi:ankyrin repeat protein
LFDSFCGRGADLATIDKFGKSAIHNLLNSHDSFNSYRPPGIRNSLLYMLSHYPALLNQPDHKGDYPIHAAFQRLRRYPLRWEWNENAELDTVIEDLLDAGADPLSRDSRGNTALHYLADEGLAELIMGEHTRRRFKMFLQRGVDVNARNQAGYSALELMLDDDGRRHTRRKREYTVLIKAGDLSASSAEQVDKEVFDMFDEAAVRWTDLGPGGRTLLHLVATHQNNPRGAVWAKLLLARGVDPSVKDNDGMTATETAQAHGNEPVAAVLTGAK